MPSGRDAERYLRQLSIPRFGGEAQERLASATVFIAGAGGLGCAAALYLTAAGVGRIRVADSGRVEPSNLNRQILYAESDRGRPKVAVMAERLAAFNPGVVVESMHLTIDGESLPELLEGCAVVVDALDNLPTRALLNRAVLDAGIPLVHGAVSGFGGQAMCVLPRVTACLTCLYGSVKPAAGPTPVIGTAAGTVGLIQATEAVKLLTGVGKPLAGRLLIYDGLEMSFTEVEVPRDPRCPGCGSGG